MPVIVEDKCKGCKLCIPVCPVDAFKPVSKKLVTIDQDVCVECYVCVRKNACPFGAIEQVDLSGTMRTSVTFFATSCGEI